MHFPLSTAEAAWTNAAEHMGANAGVYASSIQWGDYGNEGDLVVSGSSDGGTTSRLILLPQHARAAKLAGVYEPPAAAGG